MCGIAGIYSYRDSAPPVDREELLRIREAMVKRGPDGAGLWISNDQRIGLAHRRLAIIDLSEAGAQPMFSADGRLCISFNGEIYNYRELRRELEAKGYEFRSHSDTEVLLHLYAERGEAMVHALRGMFAFGIWDERKKGLFLARDHFGIKPLYYADDGATIRMASQVKALLAGGAIDTAEDTAGHASFFLLGSVADPFTLYRNIRALSAGSTLWVDRRGLTQPRQFFRIADEFAAAEANPRELNESDLTALVAEALRDSVRHHLIADVPVGVFLSSGIDSSTLVGLATEAGAKNLQTLTLGFHEYRNTANDEVPLAEIIARHFGTNHQTGWISRADFEQELAAVLIAMDQPSIDGVNTYFVAKLAAESGMKIALSGLGGDELFGGYPSFKDIPRLKKWFGWGQTVPALGRVMRRMAAPVIKRLTSPKYAGLLEYGGTHAGAYLLRRGLYMPWELEKVMGAERARAGVDALEPLLRLEQTVFGIKGERPIVSSLELEWYLRCQLLRDADWTGMAHSLEIRVPFVDVNLLRSLAPVVVSRRPPRKHHLARAPRNTLPIEVAERPKTGFTTPVRDWTFDRFAISSTERGLRGWAHRVNPTAKKPRRVLALITDAFGGYGGIAKFNRDFLSALCSDPECKEVVAIPRLMPASAGLLPAKLSFIDHAIGSKFKFVLATFGTLIRRGSFDVVICGHINLLPLAWIVSRMLQVRLVLIIHGVDAWQPTKNPIVNRLVRKIDVFIAVSRVTTERFIAWTGLTAEMGHVLPNSIDTNLFKPGPMDVALVEKYELSGKVVIMTMGRLAAAERYKGFDEVLNAMPELIRDMPQLVYMIAGNGDDRQRLEEKAISLGLHAHVIFTGYVPEALKRNYYNLASAFVMPSRGEGFGIVLLEAMACGVPVVGSTKDGSREALRDGALGILTDPTDIKNVQRAILNALQRSKAVPDGLEYFSYINFERRVHQIVNRW